MSNDLIPLFNEPEKNVLTEQLMDEEHNLNTEIKIASNDLSPLFNESEKEISTQQLMELCSGQFQTQPESQVLNFYFYFFESIINKYLF